MRQIGSEVDPLKRIQEEINEVARRENELREKKNRQLLQLQSDNENTNSNSINNNNNENTNGTIGNSISSSQSAISHEEGNSSLSSFVSKENLDEHHSDDSGISASSSPIPSNIKKYVRTNNYNVISPSPPPQKLQTHNISSKTQNGIKPVVSVVSRRVTTGPAHKGLMQRFIAMRGKIPNSNNMNGNGAIIPTALSKDNLNSSPNEFHRQHQSLFMPSTLAITPPIIERDSEGKPVRRGYVPVEEKIQKELKDLKSRETELKRIRRLTSRQSQPDLLDSIENELIGSDDDSDGEHCYPPGKLRAVKSISELCDSMNSNSISPRTTPSPNFERVRHQHDTLRPAVSLAKLCDLDSSDEAPSSHELIAKWESLIQQNA